MAEQYANCTVHHKMHSDRRFDLLGELGGWTRNDASFRMVQLWARCTAMQTDRPPAIEIRAHLGLRGEELLLTSGLGERCPDGSIRVLGGGLTGGDTDRFSWYEPLEARNTAGGLARAEQVRRTGRGPRGRFAPAGASDHQQPDQRVTSDTSDPPAIGGAPPASGFRIPEEDRNSLSRAILQSVPQPEPAPVPAASPPAPAREDIAGTHEADCPAETETGQNRPVRTSNEAEKPATPVGDRDVKPSNPNPSSETTLRASPPPAPIAAFDPNEPRAIGRLAEAFYARVSAARIAMAAELKLPEPLPFPLITPATRTRGFVELSARIREEGALAPTACERVLENAVKQARAKRSIDWLGERAFGDKAWANARDGIDPSARPQAPRRGDPPAPALARKRPDPEPRAPSRSAAELAELAAMADRLVANPDAAAAAELERGRVPAHLPTAELVKWFGDGQRAPPTSAHPDDDTSNRPSKKARPA